VGKITYLILMPPFENLGFREHIVSRSLVIAKVEGSFDCGGADQILFQWVWSLKDEKFEKIPFG
jgi:hypothetical protein